MPGAGRQQVADASGAVCVRELCASYACGVFCRAPLVTCICISSALAALLWPMVSALAIATVPLFVEKWHWLHMWRVKRRHWYHVRSCMARERRVCCAWR